MGRRKLLHDAFIRACRTRSIGTLPREHSFGSTVALPEPHHTTSRKTAPAVPLMGHVKTSKHLKEKVVEQCYQDKYILNIGDLIISNYLLSCI